ncbi:MAG TPA: DUF4956 domain-containing protein [Gemmatimonadales bacterium]|nr:DUF4956 domain-containing protein [Gemmatimonadales bacterium]
MASRRTLASGRQRLREIGRVTLMRLTLYYLVVGALLLLITALFPESPVQRAPATAPPVEPQAALEWFRHQVAVFPTGAPRWLDALVQMFGAFLLAVPIAFVYVRTRTRVKFDRSLIQTVIVLPVVVTAILVVVRDSLALAFSLAGIVAAVRFRNNLKESGDAVYIFGAIGVGFATGIHALSVAAVLSMTFVVIELALWKFNFSLEFEETFARLCMPSGADLAEISQATGEHPRPLPVRDAPAEVAAEAPGAADDRNRLLRVYVDRVDAAQPRIEAVLGRDAKRWALAQVSPGTSGPSVLEYRVRARKSVGIDLLREHVLTEGAPHVVAADHTPDGRL